MQVIETIHLEQLIDQDQFPFVFLSEFAALHDQYLFIKNDFAVCPIQITKNKLGVTHASFQFRPLAFDASNLSLGQESEFLSESLNFLKSDFGVDMVDAPDPMVIFQVHPEGSKWSKFGTRRVKTNDATRDGLFDAMHKNHKRAVKKALKEEVQLYSGRDQLNEFAALHQRTMERSGKYFEPLSYFESMFDLLEPHVHLAVVKKDDELLGGSFCLHTKYAMYYLHGASADNVSVRGANNLVHFENMVYCAEQGISYYDFVGYRLNKSIDSKLQGIQTFKDRFGGELLEAEIWKKELNPAKLLFEKSAIKALSLMKRTYYFSDLVDQTQE